ncbi:MAG: reverse transcriptase family protein [Planctomycetaceae bacterium]
MRLLKTEAHRLAAAILSGPFKQEEILQRVLPLLSGSRQWFHRLTAQLIEKFGSQRPRERDLIETLLRSRRFARAIRAPSYDLLPSLQPPVFYPSPKIDTDEAIRQLTTTADICRWLGISDSDLAWFADRRQLERLTQSGPLRHYRYRWKRKANGRCRLIEAPKFRLREIQRRLLHDVLEHIPLHEAAHGFRKARSIQTHVQPHIGRAVVLKMDLEDFFPSVIPARLTRILMHVGYPETVAEALTALCCNHVPPDVFADFPFPDDPQARYRSRLLYQRPHLPQGAPGSPAAANVCAFRLDQRLAGLAHSANAAYTRYADDLLFSGDKAFARGARRFAVIVAAIAMEEGYQVNHHKTRIMSQAAQQRAVGLVLNEKMQASRAEYDRLKAVLHHCVRHGPNSVNADQHPHFQAHLRGRIHHVAQSSESRMTKLMNLFTAINWPPASD